MSPSLKRVRAYVVERTESVFILGSCTERRDAAQQTGLAFPDILVSFQVGDLQAQSDVLHMYNV